MPMSAEKLFEVFEKYKAICLKYFAEHSLQVSELDDSLSVFCGNRFNHIESPDDAMRYMYICLCAGNLESNLDWNIRPQLMEFLGRFQGILFVLGLKSIDELKDDSKPNDGSSDDVATEQAIDEGLRALCRKKLSEVQNMVMCSQPMPGDMPEGPIVIFDHDLRGPTAYQAITHCLEMSKSLYGYLTRGRVEKFWRHVGFIEAVIYLSNAVLPKTKYRRGISSRFDF